MQKRVLFLFAQLLLVLIILISCAQKDDIVKPLLSSSIVLRPQNLPELDSLLAYQLWAVKVGGSDSEFVSLGTFQWDNSLYRFYDLAGRVRDSIFQLPGYYYDFDLFMVSIERKDDAGGFLPSGVIMLTADALDPTRHPIRMTFPISIFDAYGSFMLDSPTDDTVNSENTNKGIWLCDRSESPYAIYDTLGVTLDSFRTFYFANDPLADRLDRIGFSPPPGGVWAVDTFQVVASLDTITVRNIEIDWIERVIPDTNYHLFLTYDIEYLEEYERDSTNQILVNTYQSTMFNMPEVRQFGWRYNLWVFNKYFPSLGFPKMVPSGQQVNNMLLGHPDWGVISLGPIDRFDSADLCNQFNDNREVPNFPGEDFVADLTGEFDRIDFRLSMADDTLPGRYGVVVVGLEPIPIVLETDTSRNFPLFILSGQLPYIEEGYQQSYELHNYTQLMPVVEVGVLFTE